MTRRRDPWLRPGRHSVVTGGSSGLGLEISRQLVARGVSVTLLARDESRLAAAAESLRARAASGTEVGTLSVDIGDADGVVGALGTLAGTHPFELLVNSAGIMREGYFETLPATAFTEVMDINFHGTVKVIRAALPHLPHPGGRIVTIASIAGLTGVFGYTPYCAAKHALVGFTDALRFELEPQGLEIHLICPGEFDSPLVAALDATRTPENRAHTLTIPKVDVAQIATQTLDAVDSGREQVIPGRIPALMSAGRRLFPATGRMIGRRKIAAVYRGPRTSRRP
ncbi:SDR family NAD(P)-dependent oxidoreductase [Williamsia phyllosphaerae]|uniref:Short-chain dehydrogenase/reductase SDR n=1 Tax=Williamsia phyllosphaerae TaxID=885042 RepID=A0ABQ1UGE6_9NOCA|nr:SDR family NAD(P)-dependent oxidoreductase [Williamsia phyllosphaerae]GGF18490.1 short-chain dehydrogenase/reductase SDR [Williamsia phyllosphaerae]